MSDKPVPRIAALIVVSDMLEVGIIMIIEINGLKAEKTKRRCEKAECSLRKVRLRSDMTNTTTAQMRGCMCSLKTIMRHAMI